MSETSDFAWLFDPGLPSHYGCGYYNFSQICKAYKEHTGITKRPDNWLKSKHAKTIIATKSAELSVPVDRLVWVKRGGRQQGSIVHECLKDEIITWFNRVNTQVGNNLYVITDAYRVVCKIGITSNLVRRINSLQTGYPYELECIHYFNGAAKLESQIHKELKDHHIRGEWFDFIAVKNGCSRTLSKLIASQNN